MGVKLSATPAWFRSNSALLAVRLPKSFLRRDTRSPVKRRSHKPRLKSKVSAAFARLEKISLDRFFVPRLDHVLQAHGYSVQIHRGSCQSQAAAQLQKIGDELDQPPEVVTQAKKILGIEVNSAQDPSRSLPRGIVVEGFGMTNQLSLLFRADSEKSFLMKSN